MNESQHKQQTIHLHSQNFLMLELPDTKYAIT